jgi:hypothetical protein
MPHFYTIPIVEKEIIRRNHQPRKRDNLDTFFKQGNGTMATSPPLIVGDSRQLRRQAKGEAALGSDPTTNIQKE